MKNPTITLFTESVGDPHGRLRTLQPFEAARDSRGRVKLYVGRNAVVFRLVSGAGGERMLKCFLRKPQHGAAVYDYLAANPSPLTVPVQYLREELYVFSHDGTGAFYDVAEGPWAEGMTLESRVAMAVREGDAEALARMALTFDRLALQLLDSPWAHGDLKPENIIVDHQGGMRLIDYDAMFIPALRGRRTTETGTPSWQHPARDGGMYDKHIDDYPLALISVTLHALARDPTLYALYRHGEGMIMHPAEIIAGTSPGWGHVVKMFATVGEERLLRMAHDLRGSTPRIEGLRDYYHKYNNV